MNLILKSLLFLSFFVVVSAVSADIIESVLQEEQQYHRETQRGTCGGGTRGNGICSNGQCCSQYGWCGTSAAHCSTGGNSVVTTTSGSSAGTCGGGNKGNGICANGQCCSQYGWCGTSAAHCTGGTTGAGGNTGGTTSGSGTSSSGCAAGWTPASWTTYTSYAPCCVNSPNYNPNADRTECDLYSACDYTGDFAYIGHKSFSWVKSNNIVAFYSTTNNGSFGNKRIRISAKGKTVQALVADTCADSDCNGCCSKNAKPSGYLVDMEYWTVVNNFGDISAASGQVCWQLV